MIFKEMGFKSIQSNESRRYTFSIFDIIFISEPCSSIIFLISSTSSLQETKDAAKIFLNINSEQKPVPKSLIYDLYGVTDEERNFAINRAEDIARILNEDVNSPFYNVIKYPGTPRGKGKLDLSTVVNALKSYVDHDGKLEEKNVTSLNLQA